MNNKERQELDSLERRLVRLTRIIDKLQDQVAMQADTMKYLNSQLEVTRGKVMRLEEDSKEQEDTSHALLLRIERLENGDE